MLYHSFSFFLLVFALNIRRSKQNLSEFVKDFYEEHDAIKAMSDEEVLAFRQQHAMVLSGHGIPKPVRTFEEACFPEYLIKEIAAAGFQNPTGIQCQVCLKDSLK